MCDTLAVILPGRTLFAKNSDRNPNEGQALDWQPRRTHRRGARLKCTWIEIPQVEETRAVMLSRPFWMWGAEIGANEDGVIIGNEAVYTNRPYARTGLTGMDLLRLGLERGTSAARALEEIVRLLRKHGQGGGCTLEDPYFTYHNSFLIADARRAFVLETAGKEAAVEEASGARSISNGLTIPEFAKKYGDPAQTRLTRCRARQAITSKLAKPAAGLREMMQVLRNHGGKAAPVYSPLTGALGAPCVHAGGTRKSAQTTASWVAELRTDGAQHWVTGTAAPCLSVFKPVRVDERLDLGPEPRDVFDERTLFWRHERMHRLAMRDYDLFAPPIWAERDRMEKAWLQSPPTPALAFREADEFVARWMGQMRETADRRPRATREYWRARNAWAGL